MPHDLASTIPKLQAAKTRACGRLRCGRCVDTVRSHCDNASGQDMIFLLMRYEISYVLSYQSIMSCCFFPLLFKNLPVKALPPPAYGGRSTGGHRVFRQLVYCRSVRAHTCLYVCTFRKGVAGKNTMWYQGEE